MPDNTSAKSRFLLAKIERENPLRPVLECWFSTESSVPAAHSLTRCWRNGHSPTADQICLIFISPGALCDLHGHFANTRAVREYAEIAWPSLHSWCPAVGHGNRPTDRSNAFIVCFLEPSFDLEAEWPVVAAETYFVTCSLPGSKVSRSARNDCPTILQPSLGF